MSVLNDYLKLAVALITGDDAEATALRIQKRAAGAMNAQIAVKEARTIELQDNVDTAKENLDKARANNGKLIENNEVYLRSLFTANIALIEANDALTDHLSDITFLKEQVAIVTATVSTGK